MSLTRREDRWRQRKGKRRNEKEGGEEDKEGSDTQRWAKWVGEQPEKAFRDS